MGIFKKPTRGRLSLRGLIRAGRWDAARENPADRGSWARAELLSINASLDSETRRKIRKRARYVVANNAYAAGAAAALVNACVGASPRLQLSSVDLDSEQLTKIETDWQEWATAIGLAEKLRSLRYARFVDGEAFAIMFSNPDLQLNSGVQLDIRPLDCDRFCGELVASERYVDGITLDKYGNPVSYRVLDAHPGDNNALSAGMEATTYPARNICHWFKKLYPEQNRGVSELAPCLELFNLIDRYSKAVVQASETAADLAMVFTTDAVDDGAFDITEPGTPPAANPNDAPFLQIPWSRGMTMTVPEGWQAKQITAEQPSTGYGMLVDEILSQIGSAISVPKLLMKNSAENYNYSSARVDLQQFQIAVRLDRQSMTSAILSPVWRAWYDEYRITNGIYDGTPRAVWYYDGFFHVDPLKEANAANVRLSTNTTTLANVYGERGLDWEQELREIAREKAYIKQLEAEYGVSLSTDKNPAATSLDENTDAASVKQ